MSYDMRTWYDKIASSYDNKWFLGIREEYYEALNDYFIFMMADFKGARVLDLGCGTGRITKRIAKQAKSVHAIDFSKAMVQEAKKKTHESPNVFVEVMDGSQMSFKDGMFDIVVCLGSLEAVPDFAALFNEINRVLRPSGIVIFSAPRRSLFRALYHKMIGSLNERDPYYTIKPYTLKQLKEYLVVTGFTFIKFNGTFYYPNFVIGRLHDMIPRCSAALFKFVVYSTYFFNRFFVTKFFGLTYIVSASKK